MKAKCPRSNTVLGYATSVEAQAGVCLKGGFCLLGFVD